MAFSTVKVHQIQSEFGSAYLNILNDFPCLVGVWGYAGMNNTYLLEKGDHFMLLQFSGKLDEEEWMVENSHNWEKITKIGFVSKKEVER
jgi:hypothetical protein